MQRIPQYPQYVDGVRNYEKEEEEEEEEEELIIIISLNPHRPKCVKT